MADIAAVFGWTPAAMGTMSVDELMGWWERANARRTKPVVWVTGDGNG